MNFVCFTVPPNLKFFVCPYLTTLNLICQGTMRYSSDMKIITANIKKQGFTLIELLIVIGIIGIMAALSLLSLSSVRTRVRDTKRIADMYHIINALEFYYFDNNTYPALITSGQSIGMFMASVPANPQPRAETACANSDYGYAYSTATNHFAIAYCLGNGVGDLSSGLHVATNESLTQSGLIGWWKFDEKGGTQALDSSGALVGTIYGATRVSGCKLGDCLSFDGTDDYVGLAASTPGSSKTIIAWIYVNDISNNHQAIFGNHLAQLHANNGLSYKSGSGYEFSNGTINEAEWTQVAFVFDQAKSSLTFYINGVSAGESELTDFSTAANTIGILAPGSGNSVQPFNGRIDDLRLYNRAIPDVEIQALYNAGK